MVEMKNRYRPNFSARAKKYPAVFAISLLIAATLVSTYLGYFIPFRLLPISHFWRIIAERTISTLIAIAVIHLFFPMSLSRLKFKLTAQKFLISSLVITYLVLPPLLGSGFTSFSFPQILEGFIFSLFIGIDEETFSRGLIFSIFESYGVWIAAAVSSIHFGLLHAGNALWGGQSWSYTSAQICSAAAFGFLCVGLVLYSGSIWVPIVLHGLSDTPMQFQAHSKYLAEVTGQADWYGVLAQVIAYVAIGFLLIQMSRSRDFDWLKKRFPSLFEVSS
jgi:membrane protease YdiL (CAAX protease family)